MRKSWDRNLSINVLMTGLHISWCNLNAPTRRDLNGHYLLTCPPPPLIFLAHTHINERYQTQFRTAFHHWRLGAGAILFIKSGEMESVLRTAGFLLWHSSGILFSNVACGWILWIQFARKVKSINEPTLVVLFLFTFFFVFWQFPFWAFLVIRVSCFAAKTASGSC